MTHQPAQLRKIAVKRSIPINHIDDVYCGSCGNIGTVFGLTHSQFCLALEEFIQFRLGGSFLPAANAGS